MGVCYCPDPQILMQIERENIEKHREQYKEFRKIYYTEPSLDEEEVSNKYFHEYLEDISLQNMVDKILLWGNGKDRYFEIKEIFNQYNLWEGVSLPYLYGKKVSTHFIMKVAAIVSTDGHVSTLQPHIDHLSRVYREIIRVLPFHKIYEQIKDRHGFSRIFTKGRIRAEYNNIREKILNWIWFPIKEMKAVLGYKKFKGYWSNPAVEQEIRGLNKPLTVRNLELLRYEWKVNPRWSARFDPNYRSLVSDIREDGNYDLLKSKEKDLMIAYQKIVHYFDKWSQLSETTKKIVRSYFGMFTGKRHEFDISKFMQVEAPDYEKELILSNPFYIQMSDTKTVLEWADYLNNLSGL